MNRRMFFAAVPWFAACFSTAVAQPTVLQPFEITLLRDQPLAVTLGLNSCVLGQLRMGKPSISDPGTGILIGYTLELPYRNELTEISCIKPGVYPGFVREDKTADGRNPGWRIQLEGTKQLAIQIHKGNELEHTRGCVLLGAARSGRCSVAGSAVAMARLAELFGSDKRRPILLTVAQ